MSDARNALKIKFPGLFYGYICFSDHQIIAETFF
jgi:hypothetical protein